MTADTDLYADDGYDDPATDDRTLRERIRDEPRPALTWALGLALLLGLEAGALAQFGLQSLQSIAAVLPADPGAALLADAASAAGDVPTLLDRNLIPNEGYWNGERWVNTFAGLSPMWAWLLRATLVYAYASVFLWWLWVGYRRFRNHYRAADWTPRDDQIDRFRTHRWGQFGLFVVVFFLVMAVFAPTLGPTTLEQNILDPYGHQLTYWNAEAGSVETTTVGLANVDASSQGSPDSNVGPLTYDDYGRFHPFGTLNNGKDLFTFIAYGSRLSLFIGVASMAIAAVIAIGLSLATAYYKGLLDLFVVVTSDSVQALPVLMILILMAVLFSDTWLGTIYDGAFLLVIIFSIVYWPYLWRAIRGPTFQVSEREWIDAAQSFGQNPRAIMRKHMAPYVVGYLFVYGSMSLGGVIVGVAGLSFLGLGITPPTPEWGWAIDAGQPYVASASWHISLIPGVLITLVVTGFNALGDGIRDAIDPQSGGATSDEVAAAGGGGV